MMANCWEQHFLRTDLGEEFSFWLLRTYRSLFCRGMTSSLDEGRNNWYHRCLLLWDSPCRPSLASCVLQHQGLGWIFSEDPLLKVFSVLSQALISSDFFTCLWQRLLVHLPEQPAETTALSSDLWSRKDPKVSLSWGAGNWAQRKVPLPPLVFFFTGFIFQFY